MTEPAVSVAERPSGFRICGWTSPCLSVFVGLNEEQILKPTREVQRGWGSGQKVPASMPGFPAAQDESSPRDTAERGPCWPREPILGWFHHPASW